MRFVQPSPLIPAEAGTQAFSGLDPHVSEKTWVPAFAGMIGFVVKG
jgi:hypothetical protein